MKKVSFLTMHNWRWSTLKRTPDLSHIKVVEKAQLFILIQMIEVIFQMLRTPQKITKDNPLNFLKKVQTTWTQLRNFQL